MGLFPSYETEQVQIAITRLETAYTSTDDPFKKEEISFFLAKAHLMNRDLENATRWLAQSISEEVEIFESDAEALLTSISG